MERLKTMSNRWIIKKASSKYKSNKHKIIKIRTKKSYVPPYDPKIGFWENDNNIINPTKPSENKISPKPTKNQPFILSPVGLIMLSIMLLYISTIFIFILSIIFHNNL